MCKVLDSHGFRAVYGRFGFHWIGASAECMQTAFLLAVPAFLQALFLSNEHSGLMQNKPPRSQTASRMGRERTALQFDTKCAKPFAMMQAPDWNDYQTFLAIAREGQLMRAAKRLGVNATTIGRRLRRLEAQLGQTLFEQTREGQLLTEAGEALLASVEAMAKAASTIPSQDPGGPIGTLRISVSEGFGTWFLAYRLPQFNELYPRITVDLVASTSYLNLSRREADVAVFLSRPRAGLLVARKLAPYDLRLYASNAYLERHGTPTSLPALAHHKLVGYIPDLLSAPELRYHQEVYRESRATLRSSSINAQFAMILGGGGIGVLPSFIGDLMPELARVVSDVRLQRNFWLVMHKDTQQLQKVKAFQSWMHDVLVSGGGRQLAGVPEE
ncbi:LysR family transcriptional regulator [Novosphingobium sp. HII-3]|nr:LysR family transcriptional regulator [Novosphingobium sp. HII-3]